jgi:hypothetical protein
MEVTRELQNALPFLKSAPQGSGIFSTLYYFLSVVQM